MENENITKSIIYGNTYQNKYGKFLPICSSISDRSSIGSILEYLKQAVYFKKFNRVAYAYRVEQMPVVFITQKKNIQAQYYEGYHSDETIEGSGQKLLHLLEKFNVRNVVILVLIQQFNPLLPFQSLNYRAIVQNSRMLLDQLYKKVINFQQDPNHNKINDLLLNDTKTIKVRKVDMGLESTLPEQAPKPIKTNQRPNYVLGSKAPSSINSQTKLQIKKSASKNKKQTNINYYSQQLTFLWARVNQMKEQHEKLLGDLNKKDLQQIKYYILYDKHPLLNQVIQLLMIILGIDNQKYFIEQYNMQNFITDHQLQIYPRETIKKIDEIIKINRKLTIDSVMKANRTLGVIFTIIEIRLRYTKSMMRIKELVQKERVRVNSREKVQRKINSKGSQGNSYGQGLAIDENIKGTKAVFIDHSN